MSKPIDKKEEEENVENKKIRAIIVSVCAVIALLPSCTSEVENRIPSMPVNINLTGALWNTYGVSGFGQHREFIRELRQPSNYSWTEKSATGYGGVLLISGFNPYTLETSTPMAYDLSCPVECRSDVRIRIESDGMLPVGVCGVCGSSYDIVERAGAAKSGPALAEKLSLRRYECIEGNYGGYLIVSK